MTDIFLYNGLTLSYPKKYTLTDCILALSPPKLADKNTVLFDSRLRWFNELIISDCKDTGGVAIEITTNLSGD